MNNTLKDILKTAFLTLAVILSAFLVFELYRSFFYCRVVYCGGGEGLCCATIIERPSAFLNIFAYIGIDVLLWIGFIFVKKHK